MTLICTCVIISCRVSVDGMTRRVEKTEVLTTDANDYLAGNTQLLDSMCSQVKRL